ncbi:uncharacterized protein I303_100328 [Kwoniella dejecticola CBS 10117]|uniref:alpha-amylase n=1 Tax=Kwoniella dejecticola CBS 10117 TaxID=1296121 RepID=A0A1A6AEL6_9TREE|nr:alpha-amylase AmyA [Kwoniella dejecticola CBS 10117]OBR88512.1 alpha-amylase AmyA [Kwoniella dejecticola CBS 10117]
MARLGKLLTLLPLLAGAVQAATKDDWRSRSIYQLITDRFAGGGQCDLGSRNYCGGTWRSVIDKLDYIQGMGFDAVWISPTALGIEGQTKYGENYHGYWTVDPTQLNPHFGTSDDLKALSDALHAKGMYMMVDIAINALAATNYRIDADTLASDNDGKLLFKDPANYHERCNIKWGDHHSEEYCWLVTGGDDNDVALLDLATETPAVADKLKQWVPGYVKEYGIDGFRIDASKHLGKGFQHDFCEAAGVFCIGEVAGDSTEYAGSYQGDDGIDSVFGFGMLYGSAAVFGGGKTMPTLQHYINAASTSYSDPSVIGSFSDNQDLPRFNSRTGDKSLVYNAIVSSFLYGGIPTVYYGLEQDIADGPYDPNNREALWNYNNYNTGGDTYKRITNLNKIRDLLASKGNFLTSVATVLKIQDNDIALQREDALIVLTNRGSSGSGTWSIGGTKFGNNADVVDLLSCDKGKTDGSGALSVSWSTGQPFVFVSSQIAADGGFCGATAPGNALIADLDTPVNATGNPGPTGTDIVVPTGTDTQSNTAQVTSIGTNGSGLSTITNPDITSSASTSSNTGTASPAEGSGSGSSSGACKRSRKRNAAVTVASVIGLAALLI